MSKTLLKKCFLFFLFLLIPGILYACGGGDTKSSGTTPSDAAPIDTTPIVLLPVADGDIVYGNDVVSIDASHTTDGYIMISYLGTNPKVKLQLTTPDQTVYTYSLHGGDYETFPLTAGNGLYTTAVYENISDNQYATAFSQDLDIVIDNIYGPYLYPNQYVNFESSSKTVAKGSEVAGNATSKLDVVTKVYDYVTQNITYDTDKANTLESGYLPVIDDVLEQGQGICFDYAAVMTAMLRSQQIPTRLDVGYSGSAYHAWISVHLEDIGWVNDVIEFNGNEWTLMDPTLAASNGASAVKKYVGDGSNYQIKFVY